MLDALDDPPTPLKVFVVIERSFQPTSSETDIHDGVDQSRALCVLLSAMLQPLLKRLAVRFQSFPNLSLSLTEQLSI